MGKSTAELCCEKVAHAIRHCQELQDKYLQSPTRANARHVSILHEAIHGFPGMLGSLDCMHVPWKNFPVTYQGQFTNGKKGYPTIILEAIANYNLWFWHTAFGIPGSLNDISVWDMSKLHKALVDGTFSSIDFEFEIGGKLFNKLWFLVDGIYPQLTHFVQTLSVPLGRMWNRYAKWQEAARKDIEQAFGVLQSNFHVVHHPIKKWQLKTIQEMVTACIIMHNMMVEKRVEDGESESEGFYEIAICGNQDGDNKIVDGTRDEIENHDAKVMHRM